MNPNVDGNESQSSPLEMLQSLGQEGGSVSIAVIDGEIDGRHPFLNHLSIAKPESREVRATSHGTAVCSLIAGNGIGISPKVNVHSFPVFNEDESGAIHGCSEHALARAINQARAAGCDVLNISGASPSVNGLGSSELRKAIEACAKEGVLVVSATGNEGKPTESLPASLDSVLAVGACDANGHPAIFNNFGKKLRNKTLLASGIDMPAAAPGCNLVELTGSSFAAPVISAVSALVINAFDLPRRDPSTPGKIKNILFDTATQSEAGEGGQTGQIHFRLNISSLLQETQKYLSTQSEKRSITMSNPEIDETPEVDALGEVPDLAEMLSEEDAELAPSSLKEGSVLRENSAVKAPALKLPEINDPAPHNNVHVMPSQVAPQATTDARTVREFEKVFLIGTVGYDFGTEARLDYFTQVMGHHKGHPFDPVEMAKHLAKDDNIEQSNALIWTLKIDGMPVYAIDPDSQFAVLQFGRLVEFLSDQETKGVERVSIAGVVTGETRLFNGQVIPKISPVLRGMFNWTSNVLAELVMGGAGSAGSQTEQLTNFLNRVYYELRNRGTASEERAINYAATNAYQMKEIFDDAFKENLFLNKISAVESPVCRPDSDCWDVILEFFNPKERLTAARKLYRYTVDVSDVMPVTIGTMRSWHAY